MKINAIIARALKRYTYRNWCAGDTCDDPGMVRDAVSSYIRELLSKVDEVAGYADGKNQPEIADWLEEIIEEFDPEGE